MVTIYITRMRHAIQFCRFSRPLPLPLPNFLQMGRSMILLWSLGQSLRALLAVLLVELIDLDARELRV